jgi:hypothetical protein
MTGLTRTPGGRYDGPYGRLRELGDILRAASCAPVSRGLPVGLQVSRERAAEVRRLRLAGHPATEIERAFNGERAARPRRRSR